MKGNYFFVLAMVLLPCYIFGQDETTGESVKEPPTYESMKKSASTRMIVGGVAMAGGAAIFIAQGQKATASTLGNAFGVSSVNPNDGIGGAVAGFIIFLGGTGLLISGISKSSKANKWQAAGKFNLEANTPPIQIVPKVTIVQQGFTLVIPFSR